MPRVPCEVAYEKVTQDGVTRPGVTVTCTECDHQVVCFGQEKKSVLRAFVKLKEECPEGAEHNFYVDENDE